MITLVRAALDRGHDVETVTTDACQPFDGVRYPGAVILSRLRSLASLDPARAASALSPPPASRGRVGGRPQVYRNPVDQNVYDETGPPWAT